MIRTDPDRAPARPDLTFLRHRGRPKAAVSQPAVTQPAARPVSQPVAEPRTAADNLLDLSSPPDGLPVAGPDGPGSRPSDRAPARRSAYRPPQVTAGTPAVLTPKRPAVTLNRLQSGIGALTLEAACSPAVGDLRIGAAFVLAGGQTSLVQFVTGHAGAPRNSARPVLLAGHATYERILVDLRQVRCLERLLVYGFSPSHGMIGWGGTLLFTTPAGVRVELPLDRPTTNGVLVLASIYNAGGELTIRAEMELFPGSVRDAVTAYGFDRISWLDPATPLD